MAEYIEKQEAIEALEEQIALCDKALKSFGISMKDEYAVKVERASLAAYKEQLEVIPAADVVKVRHAKDVYKQYNKHHCEFMCSLCGGWIGVIEGGNCDFKFCPNCGAKMDGGNEHG